MRRLGLTGSTYATYGLTDDLLPYFRGHTLLPPASAYLRGQTLFSVFVRGEEQGERVEAVLEPVWLCHQRGWCESVYALNRPPDLPPWHHCARASCSTQPPGTPSHRSKICLKLGQRIRYIDGVRQFPECQRASMAGWAGAGSVIPPAVDRPRQTDPKG